MTRRINVSQKMRRIPFVAGLEERLGTKLIFTDHPGSVSPGYLKADSVRQNGFSLRVNCRRSNSGTLSVLNIWGLRRGKVEFPARTKLDYFLPYKTEEVEHYAQFLHELGLDIGGYEGEVRGDLPLRVMVAALDGLSDRVLALAEPPSPSQP